jgi:sodium-dependent dicarboxylate transporter 2/3/5
MVDHGASRVSPDLLPADEQGEQRSGVGRLIALAVGLLALALTLILPPPPDLSPAGWRMAGVALLMASWWIGEALPIAATALVPLVAFPTLAIAPSREVAQEYGHHLIFLFLGGFMIAVAMERWGLHKRIALHIVLRAGESPRRLIGGFLVAVAVLSMWISNTATTLMILPVAMAVVRHLAARASLEGRQDERVRELAERNLGSVLLLTVAYAASAGGIATLIGTPPNIILAGQMRELFPELPEIGFARWMMLGVPASVCLLALVHFVVPRLGSEIPLDRFELGQSGREVLREQLRALGPVSDGERKVLVGFLLAAALWISRSGINLGDFVLPGWEQLFPQPGYLHDATVAIAVGLTLTVLRGHGAAVANGRSVPVLDWESIRRRTPWGILLLFGGGFALARGFQVTGLAAWIGSHLHALGHLPLPLILLGICLATTFLTEVTSNTATSTMLMPILAATAVSLDVHPALLMVPAALSASCAFMLPVATPPNAIVFGSGWLSIPRMARVGLVLNVAGAIVLSLLCWLLAGAVLG